VKSVNVRYFASLRELAQKESEVIETDLQTYKELYEMLKTRYGFNLNDSQVGIAIRDEFSTFLKPICHGDTVVFIPPVAGG
jgi:molybdopterin converting factor subunit 1